MEKTAAAAEIGTGDWAEWVGGERPVDKYAIVTIRRADGREIADAAFKFDWRRTGDASDIAAYRVG